MNRNETLSRLLLTLLTAFVMVGAAFVAAVPANTERDESTDAVAIRELDEGIRETGEAPVSAFESQSAALTMATDVPSDSETGFAPTMEVTPNVGSEESAGLEPTESTLVEAAGTRAATVDAGGPYGDRDNPLYEGNPVNFEANIVGDINDNYLFRWDVDDDDVWDGPGTAPDFWGAYGDNDLTIQYNDNHIGEAKVEAWDGVSQTAVSGSGDIWDGDTTYRVLMGGYRYCTIGLKFEATEDITIDELGVYRYGSYAYTYYNIRLWNADSQALLASVNYPYIPYYRWTWFNIPSVFCPAGDYIVSVGIYYYYQIGDDMPGTTSDGVIKPLSWVRASGQYSFPSQDMGSTYAPYVDVGYSYTYYVPYVLEDTAEVFIDNVAPIVINPMSTITRGQEGSEVEFTGWFMDPGLDDEWKYMWEWGDGTQTDWFDINKWSGGAKVLIAHSFAGERAAAVSGLTNALGNRAPIVDEFIIYPGDNVPEVDFLLEYDVVVISFNYYIFNTPTVDDLGDNLADYVDLGGNVCQMTFSGGYNPYSRIKGRWESDGYNPISYGGNSYGYQSMGTVYDPGHPIMAGISSLTAYYKHFTYSVTPGATRLVDFTSGMPLVAYTNEDHHSPGGGRVVGVNFFPWPSYVTGDGMDLAANAIFWASQQSPPALLPMPIQVPLMSHTYLDDHPTTTTPEDLFEAKLIVKDDDHGRVFGGSGADWGNNIAQAPAATASNSGGGVGVWGPHRLNNGDKVGLYNDCWTRGNGGTNNWAMLEWPTPQFIGGWTAYYTRYRTIYGYTLHACEVEWWDGSSWVFDHHYDDLDHSNSMRDANILLTAPVTTTRVRMRDMKTFGANSNIMIQEWEVYPGLTGGDPYTLDGQGEGSTELTIENVWPTAIVSPLFDNVVEESVPVVFEGFELTDPALLIETEEFWYRWDYGDDTPIGPWIYKGAIGDQSLEVLLLHTYSGQSATLISKLEAIMGPDVTFADYDCGPLGNNNAPDLDYMLEFDVIVIGSNYIPNGAVGNVLDDFAEQGGGIVECVAMMHPTFGVSGEYRSKGYSTYPVSSSITSYGSTTILDPSHPIIDGEYGVVGSWGCTLAIGLFSIEPGATLLAEAGSTRALAYRDRHNVHAGSGRMVGIDCFYQPGYYSGDGDLLLANAIYWAWGGPGEPPIIATTTHEYGDNGFYDVVLHSIDDDMNWAWAPGDAQPTFVGTGDPDDWVTMDHFPVWINNVDPTIGPRMRAEVNLDLVIRTTGEPKNDCTMTLWQGSTALGSVTVHHDGNYKMETLPATLDMGIINDYYVTVEYENADPDGANPTWVFEGRFPSGHTKELKNVFKEDGTLWTIDSSLLKTMLIGEDIVFTAVGADTGSDDLAFDWQFGDGAGDINVYANLDSSMVEGTSQQPEDIFNAHPDRDPWFDVIPNTLRSPEMNPIVIVDSTSHAFMEGGFYYVTLILMDDDVCDGYPSYQSFLNGGGYDIEFIEIDLS